MPTARASHKPIYQDQIFHTIEKISKRELNLFIANANESKAAGNALSDEEYAVLTAWNTLNAASLRSGGELTQLTRRYFSEKADEMSSALVERISRGRIILDNHQGEVSRDDVEKIFLKPLTVAIAKKLVE